MTAIKDKDIRDIIQRYISNSYQPTVILNATQSRLVESYRYKEGIENDRQFKNLTPEVKRWVETSICTGVYYNRSIPIPTPILDKVWNFISGIIFPGRELRKLKRDACEYFATAEREYKGFVSAHKKLLNQIQSQIDIINKRKPLMKDYILKKVAERLSSMGIESEVADYPLESLDLRKFYLNDEFNKIQISFRELQENSYTKFLENFPNINVLLPILVHRRIQKLEKQIQDIKTKTVLIFEKMRSDNQKLENLYRALKNIAEIFTDITCRFIPTIEEILDTIETKYHNTISEIPDDLLCLLRTITKILKYISEKCILPNKKRDELINSAISASNNVTVEYENLRRTMTDAA